MRTGVAALALAGCLPGPLDSSSPVEPHPTTPELRSFSLTCDVDDDQWTLDVEASSWTGGGDFWWTVDGSYVESHDVHTRQAEPDASWETLRLELAIVADWRDAAKNSSTPFHCSEVPDGLFVLYDLDGEQVACTFVGDPTVWDAIADHADCADPWLDL